LPHIAQIKEVALVTSQPQMANHRHKGRPIGWVYEVLKARANESLYIIPQHATKPWTNTPDAQGAVRQGDGCVRIIKSPIQRFDTCARRCGDARAPGMSPDEVAVHCRARPC
jgi:hypothetical protein